jgi:hypothetical protein
MYVYSRGGPQTALAPRPSLIYCAYVISLGSWTHTHVVSVTFRTHFVNIVTMKIYEDFVFSYDTGYGW